MSDDNWGEHARIGMFIVGAEAVPEAEWWAMAPPGVSVHAARVSAPAPWAEWQGGSDEVELTADVARGAAQFASLAPAAVVMGHSSSSIAGGSGWDAAVIRKLGSCLPAGTKVTTNGLDCVHALNACGIKRPFLIFPAWFGDGIISKGLDYFAKQGVIAPTHMRHTPETRWQATPPEALYGELMHVHQRTDILFEQIVSECPAQADGVLLVGTGVRCVGIIAALEDALERPVVTANQASLWHCLALAGIGSPITGFGSLLEGIRFDAGT